MQNKREVKTPELSHREPLGMPHVRSQPLCPIARSRIPTLRILLKLDSPAHSTSNLSRSFLRRHVIARSESDDSSARSSPLLPVPVFFDSVIVAGGSPPLVSPRPKVIVGTVRDDGVKSGEFRGSGFREFVHVYFSRRGCDATLFASFHCH